MKKPDEARHDNGNIINNINNNHLKMQKVKDL